jgi:hypothetical protein
LVLSVLQPRRENENELKRVAQSCGEHSSVDPLFCQFDHPIDDLRVDVTLRWCIVQEKKFQAGCCPDSLVAVHEHLLRFRDVKGVGRSDVKEASGSP